MNIILFDENDYINENQIILKDRRLKHIRKVHRAKKEDILKIGKLNGKMGKGKITSFSKKEIILDIELNESPPKPVPINLIMAMPRPKVFQRVLRTVTTIGIKNIFFIRTWKVEKSFFESSKLDKENIKRNIILGLEQAKDTIEPDVSMKKLFKPFIEDELPEIINGTIPLVAHPYTRYDKKIKCDKNQPKTICIGPEGGFTEYEIKKLKEIGFNVFDIGNRILTVESAIPYIIGKIQG
ncbi:MAG: 16S rRNA (uracil(1498)-N(3))-methyltransferase [Fusobacteriota bacterium]